MNRMAAGTAPTQKWRHRTPQKHLWLMKIEHRMTFSTENRHLREATNR
jgi:hypothetical protein